MTHPTPDGTHYPADHVLALLDSSDAGIAAKSALTEAGFAEDDIVLFDGPEALKAIQARETLSSRLENALDRLSEDGKLGRTVYMDGLHAGQTLIMVYAPDDAAVERAGSILKQEGAHKRVALRRFSIQNL